MLLTYLAGELADAPVLVIAAYRDIEVHPGDPVATMLGTVADGATTVVVPVRGLDERAVGEMIRSFRLRNGSGGPPVGERDREHGGEENADDARPDRRQPLLRTGAVQAAARRRA
ncbi:hypothetical protein [Frankia sp. Cas4]|uniref:hypothetical protein n=1 Tax=Frankia sp. Cas4 TaxID=3073927 RepID=UPI002AD346C5|nr:hypothetical protein [Frankia sp. Cas4]